jgi:hypothetical protein
MAVRPSSFLPLRATTPLEILDVRLETDGQYTDDLGIRRPGTKAGTPVTDGAENLKDYYPRMRGQSVILQASRKRLDVSRRVLTKNSLSIDNVR